MKRDNRGRPLAEICSGCGRGLTAEDDVLLASDYPIARSHGVHDNPECIERAYGRAAVEGDAA